MKELTAPRQTSLTLTHLHQSPPIPSRPISAQTQINAYSLIDSRISTLHSPSPAEHKQRHTPSTTPVILNSIQDLNILRDEPTRPREPESSHTSPKTSVPCKPASAGFGGQFVGSLSALRFSDRSCRGYSIVVGSFNSAFVDKG